MDLDGKLHNNRLACLLLTAAAWCVGFAAFVLIGRLLPDLIGFAGGAFLSSVICMSAAFVSIYILLKGRFQIHEMVVLFASCAAVNVLVYHVFSGAVARLVVGFSLIVGGYAIGALLARMVDSARVIVPMCVVASLADAWSVIAGPTQKMIESDAGVALRHAFVSDVPRAGALEAQPVVGVADLVFVSLFLCIASRLKLGVRRAAFGIFAGLTVGLAAASLLGGVPGVPFLAAGFVVASWKDIRPGRKEIVTTAFFIAVMIAVFASVAAVR